MKKMIFTNDFVFHSPKNEPTYHKWMLGLFRPLITAVVDCEIIELKDMTDNGESFSRRMFFELSGIGNIENSYFSCDFSKINSASIDYLKCFFKEDSLVFGVELSQNLRKILESLNCKYINLAFHSYKLFDDIPLLFNTNDYEVFKKLEKYKIPQNKFEFFANYWKTYITENGLIDNDIEENLALIIGQTRKDLSVEKDNKFLNITDYGDYLETLCEKFDKVYYLPHPREKHNRESINFLKRYKNVETLKNVNVYTLLANENIKKVVAISSSVLYESQFFNKEYEYLYRPLYNIDEPYGENTFVSIYNEFFNATFWKELLAAFYTPKANCPDVNYFESCKNKLRNLKNLYWAYSDLDDIQRINKFLNIKISKKKKRQLFCVLQQNNYLLIKVFGISLKIRTKNKELNSGERQVALNIKDIRKDHTARYKYALGHINENDRVLDCACGVGYGSYLISNSIPSSFVCGLDISEEAVCFANNHYKTENNKFTCSNIFDSPIDEASFDTVVSFETLEHVKEDKLLLKIFNNALKVGGLLILSTPNEEFLQFSKKRFPYHVKHYKPEELQKILSESGFEIQEVCSQKSQFSEEFFDGWDGMFNIITAKKVK